jgi:hypothetical protein
LEEYGGVIGNKMDKQARQMMGYPGAEVKSGRVFNCNENAVRFDTNKSSLTADAKANLES